MKRTWRLALLGGTCGILILPGLGLAQERSILLSPPARPVPNASSSAPSQSPSFRGSDGLEVVQPSLSDGDSIPTEIEIVTVSNDDFSAPIPPSFNTAPIGSGVRRVANSQERVARFPNTPSRRPPSDSAARELPSREASDAAPTEIPPRESTRITAERKVQWRAPSRIELHPP
ncbi:MAG: hypothetical protein KDA83_20900, partial [Planctomycetales bacterium]|nr:hypothetical protein [Planctomycetales bacterium]